MRLGTILGLALCVSASWSCAAPPERAAPTAPPPPRPDVIVIVSDDAGYADFGCYGGTEIATPAIDAIARDGVRFTQAYVSASVCCPSRAGILTGRYQQRFGHEFNGPGKPEPGFAAEDMGLASEERTIGDAFQALGYRTACVGKWHMGTQPQFHPQARGFDDFVGILGGSRSYLPRDGALSASQALRHGDSVVGEDSFEYLTDAFTAAAVEFIERSDERPFMLYLAYTAPHTPMQAKAEDLAAYVGIDDERRRTYAAMLRALDDGVAAVQTALESRGTLENTLIVFVNDNGGATNNGSDNGPLRGMKGSKWEGGIRVPMILSWPAGGVVRGARYVHPVSALDILPTAVRAAHGTPSDGLDGVDLLPFVRGNRIHRPHDALFWRRGIAAAVQRADWKLIRVEGNPDLLFELSSDPGETMNLAAARPDRVATLRALLAAWERDLAPPRWKEGPRWEQHQRRKHGMDVVGRAMERKFP